MAPLLFAGIFLLLLLYLSWKCKRWTNRTTEKLDDIRQAQIEAHIESRKHRKRNFIITIAIAAAASWGVANVLDSIITYLSKLSERGWWSWWPW